MGSVIALQSQLRGEFAPANDIATSGVELWLSAQEIADARLPGLPKNKRKVNELASRERWAFKVAADGSALARTRKGRGGGIEYHVDLLPSAARAKIVTEFAPDPSRHLGGDSEIWSWFDQRNQETKDEAANRLSIINEIERLTDGGMTVTASISTVAARFDIGVATIATWRAAIKGIPRSDWLPHLAPRRVGGGKAAEVDPEIWRELVSQYLLPSKQPFKACYEDAKRRASARGITLPHYITLKRKLREIDPLVIIKCRDGKEALERAVPSLIRDVSHMHAMQKVNIDGHLWDVRVRWPDGTTGRPMMVAIQDVYSRKMLAWNIDKSENSVSVRKAFEKLLRQYGVPEICLCDNGRAFASKWISGGTATRNRYEIRADDPLGLLPALGIKVEWAQPYHGQSKPIERSFGFFCNRIAKCPEFSGKYTGRSPLHKPHDYDSDRAIPLADFIEVLDRRIAELNAEEGRKTQMAAGKRSVDDVFNESYAVSPVGKATPEALALALMDAKKAKTHRHDGSVMVAGNRYWSIDLSRIPGEQVIVRYNPDNLKDDVRVYRLSGELITVAPVWGMVGFDEIAGANAIKKLRKDVRNTTNKQIEAMSRLDAAELAELAKQYTVEPEVPEPAVIRPVRHRGNTSAALQQVVAIGPQATGDASLKLVSARDESALKAASTATSIDRIAAAMARQRAEDE